jgi:hypothetical protein
MEAVNAKKLNKNLIFLKLDDYKPEGWLDFIMVDAFWYPLLQDSDIDESTMSKVNAMIPDCARRDPFKMILMTRSFKPSPLSRGRTSSFNQNSQVSPTRPALFRAEESFYAPEEFAHPPLSPKPSQLRKSPSRSRDFKPSPSFREDSFFGDDEQLAHSNMATSSRIDTLKNIWKTITTEGYVKGEKMKELEAYLQEIGLLEMNDIEDCNDEKVQKIASFLKDVGAKRFQREMSRLREYESRYLCCT